MKDNAYAFVSLEIHGSFPTKLGKICGAYGGADGIFRTGPLPPGTCTLHAEWKPAFVPGNPVETWQAKGSVSGIKSNRGPEHHQCFHSYQADDSNKQHGG